MAYTTNAMSRLNQRPPGSQHKQNLCWFHYSTCSSYLMQVQVQGAVRQSLMQRVCCDVMQALHTCTLTKTQLSSAASGKSSSNSQQLSCASCLPLVLSSSCCGTSPPPPPQLSLSLPTPLPLLPLAGRPALSVHGVSMVSTPKFQAGWCSGGLLWSSEGAGGVAEEEERLRETGSTGRRARACNERENMQGWCGDFGWTPAKEFY
jgi:hypothetical protein